MAKVKYITIPAGLETYFNKAVQPNDRFVYSTIRMTNPFVSRKKRAGLTQKSLLPACSELWNNFDITTKDLWTSCGLITGLTGFRYFVQEYTLAQKFYDGQIDEPNIFFQSMVGYIRIGSPASSIKLTQLHPQSYYVLRKKTGKETMYQTVEITENFNLPLEISLSFYSYFYYNGTGGFAKFYAIIYSSYQGRDIETRAEINLVSTNEYQTATFGIGEVLGLVRGYALFFEVYNKRGIILFDNVKAVHSGQNWVRDTHCNNIKQSFTKQFFQVPAHWVALDLPDGAYYNSEYKVI